MAQDIKDRIVDYANLSAEICAAFRADEITIEEHDRAHELEVDAISDALTAAGVNHIVEKMEVTTLDGEHVGQEFAVGIITSLNFQKYEP